MIAFTPGSYIAARRRARRLSIDDVADRLVTEPHTSAIARRAQIAMIEADIATISPADALALRKVVHFDIDVLDRLVDLHLYKADLPAPRLCRICGCSQEDACVTSTASGPSACSWVAPDLCSACQPAPPLLSSSVGVPTVSSEGASS